MECIREGVVNWVSCWFLFFCVNSIKWCSSKSTVAHVCGNLNLFFYFNTTLFIWVLTTQKVTCSKVRHMIVPLGTQFKRRVKCRVNLFCRLCAGTVPTFYCTNEYTTLIPSGITEENCL